MRSYWLPVVLAALVVVLITSLPGWLWLDGQIYRWIQFYRSCDLVRGVAWIAPVVWCLLGAIILLAAQGGIRRHPWQVAVLIVAVITGAAAGELLKTIIERSRPNQPLVGYVGNSFPSGHVMNTTLLAIAAYRLAVVASWGRAARMLVTVAGIGSVTAQAIFRLVNGSHWLSDLPGSILLAFAWMTGVGPIIRLETLQLAPLLVSAVVMYGVYWTVPSWRIHLPSLLEPPPAVAAQINVADPGLSTKFEGDWVHGFREPVGAVAWLRGAVGAIRIPSLGVPEGLRMVVRPGPSACGALLEVSVNGWNAPPVALLEGWREIHLQPPAGILRTGENKISIKVPPDVHSEKMIPGRLALCDLRLTATEP